MEKLIKNNYVIFIGILCLINSCGESIADSGKIKKNELNKELIKIIQIQSDALETRDTINIKNVSTERGYQSLMEWSDDMRNKDFIDNLVYNLKNKYVFSISIEDSLVHFSLGKQDAIVGATGGFLFLIKDNNEYKLDLFKGGK